MRLKGKNSLLSIIMPVRNEEKHLDYAIESIRAQIFPQWELIIVDDHSTDSSWEKAAFHATEDPRIRIVKNEGERLLDALETGYKHSTGNLISRMDADDECTPFKYQEMVDLLDGPGTVVCGRVLYTSDDELQEGFRNYQVWLNRAISHPHTWQFVYEECVIPSPSWLIHRTDLDAIGGITTGVYPEDYDLAFRMYKAGLNVVSTNEVVHVWRDHPMRNSRTNPLYENNFFPELKAKYFAKTEVKDGNSAVVYGAGKRAKQLVKQLQEIGTKPVWITNNPEKIGKDIYGISLQDHLRYAPTQTDKIAVVVSNDEDREEIAVRLQSLGLQRGVDYWFFC